LTKSEFAWNHVQWYDFACVYAIAGGKTAAKKDEYARRAMELLNAAVKAGYKSPFLAADKDLDALRDRDDFKQFLAEFKKNVLSAEKVSPPRKP